MIVRLALFLLLFAIAAAWATASHFGECKEVNAHDPILSTCKSTLPAAGFNKLDTAPAFQSSADLPDLPTRLTRVTDNDYFEAENGQAVHSYSRRQAWNLDESLLSIGGKVMLSKTYEFLVEELPVSSEHVWSNTDADIVFGLRFVDDVLNQFISFNVRSFETEEIVTLEGSTVCSIGRGEGSQSNDDRYVLFVCGEEEGKSELISYDIERRKIVGKLELLEYVDWASVSQSGKYIVVDSSPDKEARKRLTRYSLDLKESILLSETRHHGDLGLDADGDDVFVMIGDRFISYVRLMDGKRIQLPVSGFLLKAGHGHVSCRNIKRPGWCYVSTYNNLIGAVRIGASDNLVGLGIPVFGVQRGHAIFEHWGYHESSSENYPSTPKASASPSGRQIIFSSDWRGTDQTNDYVISLQSDSP